jgi:hypothetical protein
MMILKEGKEEYKEVTRKELVWSSPPVYGCDCCEGVLNNETSLEIRVHLYDRELSSRFVFCSWGCVFKYTSEMDFDGIWFVDLPYINSVEDVNYDNMNVNGFKKALAELKG